MDERQLKDVFERCDVGWVFDERTFGEAPSETSRRLFEQMLEVDKHYAEIFGRSLEPKVADRILADVTRYKPLVQAFASPMTTPIRTMVVCILDGAQVVAVSFGYEFKKQAKIEVQIESENGELARFASEELWDAEVLRHFGLMKAGDAPIIDGYYPLISARPA